MNRLFGSAAAKQPAPTLNTAISSLDERASSLSVKEAALDAELRALMPRVQKLRPGTSAHNVAREKMRALLRRRNMLQAQRQTLEQQSWNMEQAQGLTDNLQNTVAMVGALKQSTKQLRREYAKIDIGRIDRLQDDMADLVDMGNDIQESLARSYDVPEEVDEADLDAELEALGAEMDMEAAEAGAAGRAGADADGLPSFMMEEVPEFIDEAPAAGKVQEAAR